MCLRAGLERNRMRLHVLTATTRPENLSQVAQSLEEAVRVARTQTRFDDIDLTWHLRFDVAHLAVGGQALKNAMLEQINDGWVYILDDDNAMHPALLAWLVVKAGGEDAQLIAMAQQHRNGWIRRVHRGMLKQTHVDAGQVVIRRDAIGDRRIPLHYCGDGEWIEEIADSLADRQIVYLHDPLAQYNWLRDA